MSLAPANVDELGELLRTRPGRLRLCGGGSRQHRLPPRGDALELSCRRLDRIERIDAPDQTCTVEAGVPRAALDDALHRLGLELPCPGGGTLGGLFAADDVGAASWGGQAPRTLLLGLDGLLADGTAFRAGARVVKSVAGFDVHKLLVGSAGRLFVAARLHLRLKPRPRAEAWFCRDDLDGPAAAALFATLCQQAIPPAAMQLRRTPRGVELRGRLAGRASTVRATQQAFALREAAADWLDHVAAPTAGECLAGGALPSQAAALLALLPPDSDFVMHGGGRFELSSDGPATSDQLLHRLHLLGATACIVHGAPPRRGIGTPTDAGAARLAQGLARALDPHGLLV
ncbi:MAG: FAD-binding oxidoreductase [Planctomycetes bacterium]|nr:FAD-binding oxidoreductase [Planctomycetota bacterium]